jgi:predicted molibdopterin-dependent oxidoreductase YjgC
MHYSGASAIMDEIAALTPIYGGMAYDRLDTGGLQWPCPTREHPGTKFLHGEAFTRGARPGPGKGKFHPVEFLSPKEMPDAEFPFVLTTGRMLEHYHTGTMSRRSRVLHDRVPHGAVELNPEDAEKLGVCAGDLVRVESRRGQIEIPADVTDRVPRGTLFLTFHFAEHPANALTIAALDPIAKIPEYKVSAARVKKAT